MSGLFQKYPSGFRVPIFGRERTEPVADLELLAILEAFKSGRHPKGQHSSRMDAIHRVATLFGNFQSWLDAQDRNPNISQAAYDLILDTLKFIETGKRSVSVETYKFLIGNETHGSAHYRNPHAENRTKRLCDSVKFPPEDFLFLWLQHPYGFTDMLATASFIFGENKAL